MTQEKSQNTQIDTPEQAAERLKYKGLTRKEHYKKEIKAIFLIFVLVFAFRTSFFEPFKIPSGSMIPTLMIGDFILVNKMSYGFKLPFSEWWGDSPVYLTEHELPKRGDVVVFKYPMEPSLNYIKRVIGLPGDTIEIIDKVVYVNDKPIKTSQISGEKILSDMDERFKKNDLTFFETSHGKHKFNIQLDNDYYNGANLQKIVVPSDEFFVMGDNRDHSKDSRFWGFVPQKYLKGKAIFVWFSMIIPFISDDDFKFRPHRIGTKID